MSETMKDESTVPREVRAELVERCAHATRSAGGRPPGNRKLNYG
jgi:hypothetical protein